MNKAGNSSFSARGQVGGGTLGRGYTAHISYDQYKQIMEDAFETDPLTMTKYMNLKAQFEFKDDIPKQTLLIKTREDLDPETATDIRIAMLSFINDR